MDEKIFLDAVKQKVETGQVTKGELLTLLEMLEKKSQKLEVLSAHVMELTQEMENIKSDFGNNR